VDWGGIEREENEDKISYECGAVVGFCVVSCQAADFSHGDGTVLLVLGYAAGHETSEDCSRNSTPSVFRHQIHHIKSSNEFQS
jgi:hypothetical protein